MLGLGAHALTHPAHMDSFSGKSDSGFRLRHWLQTLVSQSAILLSGVIVFTKPDLVAFGGSQVRAEVCEG